MISGIPTCNDSVQRNAVILIVGKCCADREKLVKMLRQNYYQCVTSESDLDAVNVIRLRRIDLIIVDDNFLDQGGYKVINAVRDRYSEATMPILISSDHNTRSFREYLSTFGVNHCLARPYDSVSIMLAVSMQVNIARTLRLVCNAREQLAGTT